MLLSLPSRALLVFFLFWTVPACRDRPLLSGGLLPGESTNTVSRIFNSSIDTVDILFVIDNSPRMADKQELLQKAIPAMVSQLLWLPCMDDQGEEHANTGSCPEGTSAPNSSLVSVNVGLLSSSLGGHGSGTCLRGTTGRHDDDRAHLIPTVRPDAPDPDGTGFLKWRKYANPDRAAFLADLEAQVKAIGSDGCKYPAPLEAWYRFLVDPFPPQEIVVDSAGKSEARRDDKGNVLKDQVVLAQREEFLRPSSTVLIVVVTDQDDCSVMDGGMHPPNAELGHLALERDVRFPKASPICETNPNDACCFSCLEREKYEPLCDASFCDSPEHLSGAADRMALRCSQMKKRFGIDLLYPTERYVEALTHPKITDGRTGKTVDNPLLFGTGKNAGVLRDPNSIFFSGITGVPWQTIATYDSFTDPNESEILDPWSLQRRDVTVGQEVVDRWQLLLGLPHLPASDARCLREPVHPDCGKQPVLPLDPFMRLSVAQRQPGLVHPLTGDVITGASSGSPLANSINGHEANHSVSVPTLYPDGDAASDELQASCIFPLDQPRDCESEPDCVCSDEPSRNRAICQAPAGQNPANTTQYFASATPAPRVLTVLQAVGQNALPGSLCPKILHEHPNHPSFGLSPALRPLVNYVRSYDSTYLDCIPRNLYPDESGQVNCALIEAWRPHEDEPFSSCDEKGRDEVNPEMAAWTRKDLRESSHCGEGSKISCDEYRLCALRQLEGRAQSACQFDQRPSSTLEEPGFCYVDENSRRSAGDEQTVSPLLNACWATEPNLLRLVGDDTPRQNAITYILCQESQLYSTSDHPGPRDPLPWDLDQNQKPRGDIPPPPSIEPPP